MTRVSRTAWIGVISLLGVASTAPAGLREDVDRLIRNTALKGATVAVSVRDCDSGAALVSVNPDARMIPASNMKLLTTGAALHALGPDFEFTTRLMHDGKRLVVTGDGDPAFGDPDLLSQMHLNGAQGVDVDAFIDLWVKAVTAARITNVDEVLVDDRIFDREFVHPSWPAD